MKTKFDLWLTVLAWGNSLLSVIFISMTMLLYRANIPGDIVQRGYYPDPSNIVMALLFPLVGAVILTKQRRHPIGWLLFWIGLIQSVQQLTTQYGIYALYTHPNPAGPWVAWISSNIWYPSLCLYVLLLMLFPTGRRLEGRWGGLMWLPVTCLFGALIFSLVSLLFPVEGPYFDPAAAAAETSVLDYVFIVMFILLIFSFVASGILLIKRFRSARGVERQQLKWFALGGALWVFSASTLSILDALQIPAGPTINRIGGSIIMPAATASIPISIGIAILRHRLYEIDVLIRKTLVYGALTGALALVYFGCILIMEGFLRALTGQLGQSTIAVVLSTLAVAALFTPLRRRIQNMIDRRFYRQRYNIDETLQKFGQTVRDEVDLDELSTRLVQVVQETIQPQVMILWIKRDG